MKRIIRIIIPVVILLSACSSHQKKILVYANSDIKVDDSQKNITVTDGNTQIEKQLSFTTSEPVVLNISGPGGNYTLEAKEDGFFLVNLKKDTVVGSLQHTGTTKQTRVTQEQLKIQLDSLNKLVIGSNISANAKNYFLPPGKIVKISNQTSIKVFGPFEQIPNDFEPPPNTEVYKFFNVSEVRKIIGRLTEMSSYKYQGSDSSEKK